MKKHIIILFFLITQLSMFAVPPPGGGGGGGLPIPGGNPPEAPMGGVDECSAVRLNTGLSCTQYNNDTTTTTSQGDPACWKSAPSQSVWFSFIAEAKDMTISTDTEIFVLFGDGPLKDTQLALYHSADGTCNTLSEVGCDEDEGINVGSIFAPADPAVTSIIEKADMIIGDTYYIRVDGHEDQVGVFCLSAFDTYTPGSKSCEAQSISPNNNVCGIYNGNAVVNSTSSNTAVVDNVQPGAYIALGEQGIDLSCNPNINPDQYGTWTTWIAQSSDDITVTNNTGNAVDYTLYTGRICRNIFCTEYQSVGAGGSATFSGISSGETYYILTTLTNGSPEGNVQTDLCITNNSDCTHKKTAHGDGTLDSTDTDFCENAIGIVIDQVYTTSTFCASASPSSDGCNPGKNTYFYWDVPADYEGPAFFQAWNKNCAGGPNNKGIRIIGAATDDICASGSCTDFMTAGDEENADHSTNIGWDAGGFKSVASRYWAVFSGGIQPGETDPENTENCDYSFMIGSTPSLKGIEVTNDTICLGESTVLTATGATEYSWTTGADTESITVSPTSDTTYTVYAVTGATGYDISYVTVIQPEDHQVVVDSGSICPGGATSVTLNASAADTYTWTPGTNLDVTNGPTVVADPPSTTTYTVTGTNFAVFGGFEGCESSAISLVNVSNAPLNPEAGTDTIVCASSDTKQMGATPTTGLTYLWSPTTGLDNPNIANPLLTLENPGTITYTVTVSDGCVPDETDVATITIDPSPSGNISGATTICSGSGAVDVTFTGTGGTAPYDFTYSLGGGTPIVITGGNPTLTVSQSDATGGIYSYELISVADASGCSQGQPDTIVIEVENSVTATIAGSTTICEDEASPNITFSGAGGTAPYTFSYTITGTVGEQTITTAGTNTTVTAPTDIPGTFTYSLTTVQDATTSSCVNASGSEAIIVNPLPTATIAGSATVCLDGVAPDITFTGAGGTGPYIFSYTVTGIVGTQTVTGNPTATVSQVTNPDGVFDYTLLSVADANCSQDQTGTETIEVFPLPTATMTGDATLCLNDPEPDITFTGADGTGPYEFTYTLEGVSATTTGDPTVTVAQASSAPGDFDYVLVSVTDANCTQAQAANVTVSINPLGASLAGTTTVCQNSPEPTITFTGGGGTANYTFTYNRDGAADQTITSTGDIATITHPTGPLGVFVYSVTQIDDAAAQTCYSSPSVTVTVVAPPTATISGDANVCLNAPQPQVIFEATGGGGPPYIFTFNIDGNPSTTVTSASGSNTVSVNANTSPAGAFVYNLESVEDSRGCNQAQPDNITITVNDLTATLTGDATECQDGIAPAVTFTGIGGVAPYIFNYTMNGGNQTANGTTANVNQSTVAPGTFSYDLVSITDNNSLNCLITGNATIVVTSPPDASITGASPICEGETPPIVTFDANGTGPFTINYTIDGAPQQVLINSGNSTSQPVSATTAGNYLYSLTNVTDGNNCEVNVNGTTTIIINPSPSGRISTTTPTVCAFYEAIITFSIISQTTGPYTFDYTLDGVSKTVSTTGASISENVTLRDAIKIYTYDLNTVTDINGCQSSPTTDNIVLIDVNVLKCTTTVDIDTVCIDDAPPTVTFQGAGGVAPYTFTYTIKGIQQTPIQSDANGRATVPVNTSIADNFEYVVTSMEDSAPDPCDGNITDIVAQTTVVVLDPPTGIVDVIFDAVCLDHPQDVVFAGTGTGADPQFIFTYIIDGDVANPQPPALSVSGTSTAVLTNIPTDEEGAHSYAITHIEQIGMCQTLHSSVDTYTVLPLPDGEVIGPLPVCEGETDSTYVKFVAFDNLRTIPPYTFSFTENGESRPSIKLNDSLDTLLIQINKDPGRHIYDLVLIKDGNGCPNIIDKDSIEAIVNPVPRAIFSVSPESVSILENTIEIFDNSKRVDPEKGIYTWDFGDGSTESHDREISSYTYADTGTYKILLTVNNDKCEHETSNTVRVFYPLLVYVPNSFTPNNDGLNDIFAPKGDGLDSFEMKIYDRWGNMIFFTDDILKGWDGTANGGSEIAQLDVYIYVINVVDEERKQSHTYRGTITLLAQ